MIPPAMTLTPGASTHLQLGEPSGSGGSVAEPALPPRVRSKFLTAEEAAACRRILGVVLDSERARQRDAVDVPGSDPSPEPGTTFASVTA